MKPCSPDPRRALRRALIFSPLVLALTAAAAPRTVEAFDAGTWAALQAEAGRTARPLLVVFSATWCAVCPALIAELAADPRRRRAGVPLLVVLADMAPGDDDARLLASPHYRAADRLLAFDGPAAPIRHAVDPRWRGLSPSVAWLAPGRPPHLVQGVPDPAELAAWLDRR